MIGTLSGIWVVGGALILLVSAIAKHGEIGPLRTAIEQITERRLPDWVLSLAASSVIAGEWLAVALLLLAPTRSIGSLLSGLLFAVFAIADARSLSNASLECGCLGDSSSLALTPAGGVLNALVASGLVVSAAAKPIINVQVLAVGSMMCAVYWLGRYAASVRSRWTTPMAHDY